MWVWDFGPVRQTHIKGPRFQDQHSTYASSLLHDDCTISHDHAMAIPAMQPHRHAQWRITRFPWQKILICKSWLGKECNNGPRMTIYTGVCLQVATSILLFMQASRCVAAQHKHNCIQQRCTSTISKVSCEVPGMWYLWQRCNTRNCKLVRFMPCIKRCHNVPHLRAFAVSRCCFRQNLYCLQRHICFWCWNQVPSAIFT